MVREESHTMRTSGRSFSSSEVTSFEIQDTSFSYKLSEVPIGVFSKILEKKKRNLLSIQLKQTFLRTLRHLFDTPALISRSFLK